jgi:hypothetical protein
MPGPAVTQNLIRRLVDSIYAALDHEHEIADVQALTEALANLAAGIQTITNRLAGNGAAVTVASPLRVKSRIGPGLSNDQQIILEMPTGAGFAKTSPFVIINSAAYFEGDAGITPDQPFAMGRLPVNPQDVTYSIATWIHEVDYNPFGYYTSQERYDVVRGAGPGSDTFWDYPSGDYLDSRRVGYAYEVFSNNLGNAQAGTVSMGIVGDSCRWDSNFCNPLNPLIGEIGTYGSIGPNQQTGAVSFAVGCRHSQNFRVDCTATSTRAASSGQYFIDGTGVVAITENAENLFLRMNDAGSKRIEIYADGVGKSIRIGGSLCAMTVSQNAFNFEYGNIQLGENYTVGATAFRVPAGGLFDMMASDPGKVWLASDGYAIYGAARDAANVSFQMFAASAYWTSFTLKPETRFGWGATLGDPPTHGFRLTGDVVQVANAVGDLIAFEAGSVGVPATGFKTLPVRTIATLPLVAASDRQTFILADNGKTVHNYGGAFRYADGTPV